MKEKISYETFKELFTVTITALVARMNVECHENFNVQVHKVNKNGKNLTAVFIKEGDENEEGIGGTMYMEELHEMFMRAVETQNVHIPDFEEHIDFEKDYAFMDLLASLAIYVINTIKQTPITKVEDMPDIMDGLKDMDTMENLQLRLLPAGGQDFDFSSIPHNIIGDIAIACSFVKENGNLVASCTITEKMLDQANGNRDKLFETAVKNSQEHYPEKLEKQAQGFYTVTAPGAYDEAIAIFYPGVMRKLAKWIGSDLLVLPVTSDVVCVLDETAFPVPQAIDMMFGMQLDTEITGKRFSKNIFKYSRSEERLDVLGGFDVNIVAPEELPNELKNLLGSLIKPEE